MALYLLRAEFENVRGFRELSLDFGTAQKPRLWTVVIGNNGHGKSTILRGIALGLCDQKTANALLLKVPGSFVRRNRKGASEEQAAITLTFTTGGQRPLTHQLKTIVRSTPNGEIVERSRASDGKFPWADLFVGGYGVNRGTRGTSARSAYSLQHGLSTLFDDKVDLLDPESVLRDFRLRSFEQKAKRRKTPKSRRKPAPDSFEALKKLLWRLWNLKHSHKLEVASDKVVVHGPWGGLPFHALGDGYRGTAGWVLDLLGSYMKAGQWEPDADVRGIVLIDEVDEHLHPEWQRRIITQLKGLFPKVQFVATTHSPLTIVDTKPGEVVATVLHNAVAILESQPLPDPSGKTPNEILTDWFGMSSLLSTKAQQLLDRYREAIEKGDDPRKAELRKELQGHIGTFVTSPMDELAIEIAAEARKQLRDGTTEEDRRRLIEEHAAKLRARLGGGQ